MKKSVMEEYCKNARNMTERNEEKIWGKRNLFKSDSVQRRTAEKVSAECCYASDNFLHLEMYRYCSIIGRNTVR